MKDNTFDFAHGIGVSSTAAAWAMLQGLGVDGYGAPIGAFCMGVLWMVLAVYRKKRQ